MPRTPKQATDGSPSGKGKRSTDAPKGNGGAPTVSDDEVARKAYEIYQSRGGEHGADFDDWIEAEKQLKGSRQQQPPPRERRKGPRAGSGV